jgi:hypothetical protein
VSRRSTPRFALAAWVAALTLFFATGPLVLTSTTATLAGVLDAVLFVAVMQGMATLGVLIARREPRNPIAWIVCAAPVLVAVSVVTGAYAAWARDHHPHAPGAAAADWLSTWPWVVGLVSYAPAHAGAWLCSVTNPERPPGTTEVA